MANRRVQEQIEKEPSLPRACRSILTFGLLKLKKLPIDLIFWTGVILSVQPNDDNYCTFSIFIYFHRKYKADEADLDLKFSLFFVLSASKGPQYELLRYL